MSKQLVFQGCSPCGSLGGDKILRSLEYARQDSLLMLIVHGWFMSFWFVPCG